jgi:uncharacterized protein
MMTRRRFLGHSATSVAALGLYSWGVEPHWLEVVYRPLPVRGLPNALAGRTLVQISDVHVGTQVDDEYVVGAFRRIAELQPEIVVMTGDFISYHPGVFAQAAIVYRHFPQGRLATLAILGNHDYGRAWSDPAVADAVVDTVAPLGIRVLRNEIHDVEGLQIVGFDDWWGRRFEPGRALAALDVHRPAIALSHNPDTVDLPVWSNFRGWILSGHTHGGQCKPPFLPPPIIPVKNKRYTAGAFELSGTRSLYISRGVGHLTRVRFNVRPEVTVFRLERS